MNDSFLQIGPVERGTPRHIVPVEIAGTKIYAFNLVSIDADNKGMRDTLILKNPEDVIALLPPSMRQQWREFSSSVINLQTKWGFHGVPTLKKVLRLFRDGEILQSFNIATVAHHYGAVPALVIGEIDGFKVALMAERFGLGYSHKESREEEVLEVLLSLNEFLPALFRAYYEQIANYLMAVFFTANEKRALSFCLRARELITRSIRGKLELVEERVYKHPQTDALALALRENYQTPLLEGRVVDALGHLIVNYIYGFFCINNRGPEYSERLQKLPAERDITGPSPAALMKWCGENVVDPDDGTFLEAITGMSAPAEKWLRDLLQVGAFVAEVVRSTRTERLDTPRIFVTYHFGVDDSESFFDSVSDLHESGLPARITRGRHVGPNIRWSVLARLWVSDYHVLFLPKTWAKRDGATKNLKEKYNWVNLELLYGQLIQRELRIVAADEALIEPFAEHVDNYTNEREIEQIDEHDWDSFVIDAKKHLRDILRAGRHIGWSAAGPNEEFLAKFKDQVLDPAGRKLIEVLFHAWCYFFDPSNWSLVQAMLAQIDGLDDEREFTAKEIAHFVWANREDAKFQWVQRLNQLSPRKRSPRVKTDLGDEVPEPVLRNVRDRLSEVADFEFGLYEGGKYSVLDLSRKRPITVKLRISSFYHLLARKFDLEPDQRELSKIVNALREPRKA